MLGHRLFTKQTGREGKLVSKLIMCQKIFTRREYYFACKFFFRVQSEYFLSYIVALERSFDGPVIITSTQGGGNIEEIAAEFPEAIIRQPIDIITGLERRDALEIAGKLQFRDEALQEVFEMFFIETLTLILYF
jgi:succinyl-CoA synthetase beta subunit